MDLQFNKKVLYYYDDVIGTYQYAPGHPMKPFRVAMTDDLVKNYGLYPKLDIFDNEFREEYLKESIDSLFTKFHSDDYIDLIKNVTLENKFQYQDQLYRYNFGEDCPVIDRMYQYCTDYSSASVGKVHFLNILRYLLLYFTFYKHLQKTIH